MGFQHEVETPNITGHTVAIAAPLWQNKADYVGALYSSEPTGHGYSEPYLDGAHNIGIDASRSSTIYSGTKVQVSALQVLACIKF